MPRPLVPQIRFVPLVADVPDEISPRDTVSGFDQVGVGDGAKRLANVGGVGYVAVGREEDGTEAGGVGSVAEVGVCCLGCADVGLAERWRGKSVRRWVGRVGRALKCQDRIRAK